MCALWCVHGAHLVFFYKNFADNTYGQQMTGHQQETAIFNTAVGQSYGTSLQNEVR